MYNAVSQVVFFHDPKYPRRVQEKKDLKALSEGSVDAIHVIPCISQMYPGIEILYESDSFDASGSAGGGGGGSDGDASRSSRHPLPREGFAWLVVGRLVYLLAPDGRVFHHDNIVVLLYHCLAMQSAGDRREV